MDGEEEDGVVGSEAAAVAVAIGFAVVGGAGFDVEGGDEFSFGGLVGEAGDGLGVGGAGGFAALFDGAVGENGGGFEEADGEAEGGFGSGDLGLAAAGGAGENSVHVAEGPVMIDHFLNPFAVFGVVGFALREGPDVDVKAGVAREVEAASAGRAGRGRSFEKIGVAIEMKVVEVGDVIEKRVGFAADGL